MGNTDSKEMPKKQFDDCTICAKPNKTPARLFPCNHDGLCVKCANKWLEENKKNCPYCRQHVQLVFVDI
jgi:hypothetical protein